MEAELRRALRAACEIARREALEVDREGRFPQSALDCLREQGLLAMAVPARLGGGGTSLRDVAEACFQLGRCCGSTALIFAMHQIQIGALSRCADARSWHEDFVREAAARNFLIASSTTEGQPGGRVDLSAPSGASGDDLVFVDRAAAVISYLEQADALLLLAPIDAGTLRDGAPAGQRLMVAMPAQFRHSLLVPWSGLGLRGTCTHTYAMRFAIPAEQMLPGSFPTIDASVMLPLAHSCLAAAWLGMAAAAIDSAQAVVAEKQRNETLLLGVIGRYEMLSAAVASIVTEAEAVLCRRAATIPAAVMRRLTLLKVTASDAALEVALDCLKLAGFAGYESASPNGVGRQVRDLLAAPIMISNFRILEGGRALAAAGIGETLFE